jgi:hypothetical protein
MSGEQVVLFYSNDWNFMQLLLVGVGGASNAALGLRGPAAEEVTTQQIGTQSEP